MIHEQIQKQLNYLKCRVEGEKKREKIVKNGVYLMNHQEENLQMKKSIMII